MYYNDVHEALWKLVIFFQKNRISLNEPFECPEYKEFDGVTLLSLACMWGNEKIIEYLLDAGALPNCCNKKNGFTPLLYFLYYVPRRIHTTVTGFSWNQCSKSIVNKLLRYGADPYCDRTKGLAFLLFTVRLGCIDLVTLLLKYTSPFFFKVYEDVIFNCCLQWPMNCDSYMILKFLYRSDICMPSKKIALCKLALNYKDYSFLNEVCLTIPSLYTHGLPYSVDCGALQNLRMFRDDSFVVIPDIVKMSMEDINFYFDGK